MPFNPLLFVGAFNVLSWSQKAIAAVLPKQVEENLRDEAVRTMVVDAADEYLTKTHPEVTLVTSEKTRKKHLRMMLDMALDDLLLPNNP